MKIAVVNPVFPPSVRNLFSSIIEVLRNKHHIEVDVINPFNAAGEYSLKNLDPLLARRASYHAVIVVDLGWLDGTIISKKKFSCPLVLVAGDDPQNFRIDLRRRIRRDFNLLAKKIFCRTRNIQQINTYGNVECARHYDIVFTSQKNVVEWYRKAGIKRVYWLPYWADTTVFRYDSTITSIYDVVTVMANRLRRTTALAFLNDNPNFSFSNGHGNYGKQCARYYHLGRIVFNMSNFDEYTMRVPEAMACGRLLLTDRIPVESGLFDHFIPGRHLDCYGDLAELEDKVLYYVKNESERNRIAMAGLEEILKYHTQDNRASQIISTIREML